MGIFHAIVLTMFPLLFLESYQGVTNADIYTDGVASYICIMLVTSLVIFFETQCVPVVLTLSSDYVSSDCVCSNWTSLTMIAYYGSLLAFVGCALVYDGMDGELFGTWARLLSSTTFWLTALLCVGMSVLPPLALQGYRENFLEFKSDPVHILQRAKLSGVVRTSVKSAR
ncbi:Aste57867_18087 [Aphanomyces stellatus]|uniref:Aste57867_18087 protein n=1 Tax=Aphanomyces stellatus TaxID=120398 RepID=A0A485L9E8_9STRA|nr:hypothetical protein As57867_018025 [Aphanomyces stellatus]VFT94826.1 Aste57867_18087 [Aphanomyces stellatus]